MTAKGGTDQPQLFGPPRSAYIHIPFCVRKCGYCDFVSFPDAYHLTERYIEALLNEIAATAAVMAATPQEKGGGLLPLDTVYFGGGTPGSIPANSLVSVLDALRQCFGLATGAEITVEVNPGAVSSDDMLDILRGAGFDRLSVGLQAVQPRLLDLLGRIHRAEDFDRLVRRAKASGWERVSGDFMLGLPGQTSDDVRETLRYMLDAGVDHVSFYSLSIEPGTPFERRYGDGEGLPSQEEERAMYHAARLFLAENGFEQYEISNAGLPGCRSRHNLAYWRGEPYYGFGCGACAFVCGERRSNSTDLDSYIMAYGDGLQGNEKPAEDRWEGGLWGNEQPNGDLQGGVRDHPVPPILHYHLDEVIDPEEARLEYFFLGFRCLDGISLSGFERRFGDQPSPVLVKKLDKLSAAGLIDFDGDNARLSEKGLDLANLVFMEFLPEDGS